MNLTGQQTRGKSESETRIRGAKPTQQATMPPSRTWLWLLGVLLANVLLGVVRQATALRVIYLDIILYSLGGVIGTMHHLYFSGTRWRTSPSARLSRR
jgi:hypothetical protein